MCDILDKIENRGRLAGINEGIEIGKNDAKIETAIRMHKKGISLEDISYVVSSSIIEVDEWISSFN